MLRAICAFMGYFGGEFGLGGNFPKLGHTWERVSAAAEGCLSQNKRDMGLGRQVLRWLWIGALMLAAGSAQACLLKTVWEPFEPYQYLAENGTVTGLDIDLLNAVAREAGCYLQIEHVPWKRAQAMLGVGALDVASGASKTADRESFARFSEPYRSERIAVYLRRADVDKFQFTSLAELAASVARVGVVHGYTYGDEFVALNKRKAFRGGLSSVLSDNNNFKRLLSRHVDVVLIEPFVARKLIADLPDPSAVKHHGLMIETGSIYFMFSKKSVKADMVERFNHALSRIKQSGEYERILARYFATPAGD